MHNLFKINTVLATVACTCLTGNVLAGEVNTCSNNSQSQDICPVTLDNKKATTFKSLSENLSSNLYAEVSQQKEKDETEIFTRVQSSPNFDTTQVTLMLLGMVVVTIILNQNRYEKDSNWKESDSINQAKSRLQKKLLSLVKSPETAKSLFLNIQTKYPERSANWLLEKIIYDLERDRRVY